MPQAEVGGRELGAGELDEDLAQLMGKAGRRFAAPARRIVIS